MAAVPAAAEHCRLRRRRRQQHRRRQRVQSGGLESTAMVAVDARMNCCALLHCYVYTLVLDYNVLVDYSVPSLPSDSCKTSR